MEELRRHGYDLGPGTLYPILHTMEQAGYLEQRPETVHGKVRKYYTITDHGRQALAEAKQKIRELVDEVVEQERASSASNEDSEFLQGEN